MTRKTYNKKSGISCMTGIVVASNINGAETVMFPTHMAALGLVAIIGWLLTFIYAIALTFSKNENTLSLSNTGIEVGNDYNILERMMNRIIIGRPAPRWRRWLSLSLTTIMLAAIIWISNNNLSLSSVFAGTADNNIIAANQEGEGGVAAVPGNGDIAPGFLADALDRAVYLAPGEFTESRLLAENYEYADAETPESLNGDFTQEFYMPYGSFTEEMLYGHAPEAETPAQEVVAENTLPFSNAPAQCGIRDHGNCSAGQSATLELL